MDYVYCADCGYGCIIDNKEVNYEYSLTINTPLLQEPIAFLKKCPICGKERCGRTYIENDSMDNKVFLRSVIWTESLLNFPREVEKLDI